MPAPCLICGYDREGLAPGAPCPECGSGEGTGRLYRSDPAYLRRLHRGARLMFVMSILMVFGLWLNIGINNWLSAAFVGGGVPPVWVNSAVLVAPALQLLPFSLLGWSGMRIMRGDAVVPSEFQRRLPIRFAFVGWSLLCFSAGFLTLFMTLFALSFIDAIGRWFVPLLIDADWILIALDAAMSLFFLLGYFASLVHLGHLARRMERPDLQSRTRRYLWLAPCAIAAIVALDFALPVEVTDIIVTLAWLWFVTSLLYSFSRAFRQTLAESQSAQEATSPANP